MEVVAAAELHDSIAQTLSGAALRLLQLKPDDAAEVVEGELGAGGDLARATRAEAGAADVEERKRPGQQSQPKKLFPFHAPIIP